MEFILAIDQGTTATTALIIDRHGKLIAKSSAELPQHFPNAGWVEHCGHEIKRSVELACKNVLESANIKPNSVLGIGITNQRETVCVFDKHSEAVLPFIVWQCRRSAGICEDLRAQNLGPTLHQTTGLHLDPYFSASKLLWLFRENEALLKRAQKRDILFGTVDTFLCHWLSGGALHITDATNACRTMLMDLRTCQWSEDCLNIFSVPPQMLPTIKNNLGPYGKTSGLSFLSDGIPIVTLVGDQQAALFGHTGFEKGDTKVTFGTGSFILLNTGPKPIYSQHGLLTSIAYQVGDQLAYCLEGSAFIAGALVQFLRDNLSLVEESADIEALARTVPDNGGLTFIPALCGLGAPHWQPQARGLLAGLERGTTKGHIARAALEAIALQNTDIMLAMANDGMAPTNLKVDGGASQNNLLIQIQADLLGLPCLRPPNSEITAMGAAYLAGLALGVFLDLDHLKSLNEKGHMLFQPRADRSWAHALIERYRKLISLSM